MVTTAHRFVSLHSDALAARTCHSTMTRSCHSQVTRIACGKRPADEIRVTEQTRTCHSTVTPTRTYSRRDNTPCNQTIYSLGRLRAARRQEVHAS